MVEKRVYQTIRILKTTTPRSCYAASMKLNVLVIPNASRNEIVGWHDGALKIRLAAPPVDGKANDELVRFLAKQLDLAPSEIEIEHGQSGRRKRVLIPLAEEDVRAALAV